MTKSRLYRKNQKYFKNTDIFIASYPRSGNTWMRLLISDIILQIQGLPTDTGGNIIPDPYKVNIESWYQDPRTSKLPFRIIKTHEPYDSFYTKVIHIFRQPADALCSYYHYLLRSTKFRESNQSIDTFCSKHIKNWCFRVDSYIQAKREKNNSIFFVSYEKLHEAPVNLLEAVSKFIGLKVDRQLLLKAIDNQTFEKLKELQKLEDEKKLGFYETGGYQDFFRSGKVENAQEELSFKTMQRIERQALAIYQKARELEIEDCTPDADIFHQSVKQIKSCQRQIFNIQENIRKLSVDMERTHSLLYNWGSEKDLISTVETKENMDESNDKDTDQNIHTFDNGIKLYKRHLIEVQRARYQKVNLHEPEEERWFSEILLKKEEDKDDSILVDVGAAVGYYCILAKQISPSIQIHAFEPLTIHQKNLLENLHLNGVNDQNITLHKQAIAATIGECLFQQRKFSSHLVKSETTQNKNSQSVLVQTITLDKFCCDIQPDITLVKVDVQGGEIEVLQGAAQASCSGKIKNWIIGTHGKDIHRRCLEILRSYGYTIIYESQNVLDQPDGIVVASKSSSFPTNLLNQQQTTTKKSKEKLPLLDGFSAQKMLLQNFNVKTIFDVGANVGKITAKYRELFPQAKIYSFEPFPEEFQKLQLKFKEDNSVELQNFAVGKSVGVKEFYVNQKSATNSLLSRPKKGKKYYSRTGETVSVTNVCVKTIDEFCREAEISEISILKMDIQGGELLALQGAIEQLSASSILLIYAEVFFVTHYENSPLFYEICSFLAEYQYTLYGIYNIVHARDGQMRYADAIFLSSHLREVVEKMS
ncbi:MAG: FkbM family methyltransferase [Okeania sp. SIO1H6]|nr:FkbM family methyltransferase [Okeania sp. SIO1H6]